MTTDFFIFMYFMLLVLWGAPEHRLWGAIVRFDDDDEHNLSVLGGVRV